MKKIALLLTCIGITAYGISTFFASDGSEYCEAAGWYGSFTNDQYASGDFRYRLTDTYDMVYGTIVIANDGSISQALSYPNNKKCDNEYCGQSPSSDYLTILSAQDSYTSIMASARIQAIARMEELAKSKGANAIYDMHFDSVKVIGKDGKEALEITAYGTPVKVINPCKPAPKC